MKKINFEITSRCTLSCSECSRTIHSIDPMDIPTSTIFKILDSMPKCELVDLSGNEGDPIYHPDFHDIIGYINHMPSKPQLYIETNGSARSASWWLTTSQLLHNDTEFVFSIDGLENTNHIYRKNAKWKSIKAGIDIMAQSNVKMIWKFIVFGYNEHQVIEAYLKSKEMGFSKFIVSSSNRFGKDDYLKPKHDYNYYTGILEDYINDKNISKM